MSDPFSAEIPELLNDHLEHLKASAISLGVIRERGYRTVFGHKELADLNFSKAQQRHPGILIPLHGVEGDIVGHQFRPDHPRVDAKRGRNIKYETPAGGSIRLDVPPRCQPQLADPSIPLYFTEGSKKVDALATVSVCAVGLHGVWGFKGKNSLGGITVLADFDHIALKGRVVYLCFDSDLASNPQVYRALLRLKQMLQNKGAYVHILQLEAGPNGEKVGIDDYLSQGNKLTDLLNSQKPETFGDRPSLRTRSGDLYCVEDGRLCWNKTTPEGESVIPLCNFNATITEQIVRDNGIEQSGAFLIEGADQAGKTLPANEVPLATFESMSWVVPAWGLRGIVSATQTAKPKLREAIMLQSVGAPVQTVYSHTGWRIIDEKPEFLTAAGALGRIDIDVELEEDMRNYYLPDPPGDPMEALQASYDFLNIGNHEATLPIWATMFLSPLSHILEPAFTVFVVGHSGSFKSTLSALALCHFGQKFSEFHLPAAWRDTENKLEKMLFLCKDLPLVIDDWAPGADSAKARELEVKAEHVIRAQGNKQGRGRLRSDTSSRMTYIPRGMLLTSGEQLPSGYSHTARIFSVELDGADISLERLSAAQEKINLYCFAMSSYIQWLQKNWERLNKILPQQYLEWREQARTAHQHPRLSGVVAWLYAGLSCALDFMSDSGFMSEEEARRVAAEGMEIFVNLSAEQSGRVDEQRPGKRFLEGLRTLMDQGKAVLWSKDDEEPRKPSPGETFIGWSDGDGHMLLNPIAAYAMVKDFCQHTDTPMTFKEVAVWKDLKMLEVIDGDNGCLTTTARIYGVTKRIIKLRNSALNDEKS